MCHYTGLKKKEKKTNLLSVSGKYVWREGGGNRAHKQKQFLFMKELKASASVFPWWLPFLLSLATFNWKAEVVTQICILILQRLVKSEFLYSKTMNDLQFHLFHNFWKAGKWEWGYILSGKVIDCPIHSLMANLFLWAIPALWCKTGLFNIYCLGFLTHSGSQPS